MATANLAPWPTPALIAFMEPEQDSVLLASFHRRYEAEIAQGYLHDAGIECVILADDAGGADLGLPLTRRARLFVLAADEERAYRVLGDAGVLGDESGAAEDQA
jgi:hypothetical protein